MRITNLRIGTRLCFGLGFFFAIIATLIVLGHVNTRSLDGQLNQIVDLNTAKIGAASAIKDSVNTANTVIMSMLMGHQKSLEAEKPRLAKAREGYAQAIDQLDKLENNAKGKEILGKMKERIASAREVNDAVGAMENATKKVETGVE